MLLKGDRAHWSVPLVWSRASAGRCRFLVSSKRALSVAAAATSCRDSRGRQIVVQMPMPRQLLLFCG